MRVSNELKKQGLFVSPGGVRSVWLRHDLEIFAKRLKALEAKTAQDGLILTEDQVNPVMSVALDNGLEVTALHNHFFWDSPKVMFMHIGGMGDEEKLAAAVGKLFANMKQTSGGKGEVPRRGEGVDREAPDRLGDDPEHAREPEPPDERRGWRVAVSGLLAGEHVHRERDRRPERLEQTDRVERARMVRAWAISASQPKCAASSAVRAMISSRRSG